MPRFSRRNGCARPAGAPLRSTHTRAHATTSQPGSRGPGHAPVAHAQLARHLFSLHIQRHRVHLDADEGDLLGPAEGGEEDGGDGGSGNVWKQFRRTENCSCSSTPMKATFLDLRKGGHSSPGNGGQHLVGQQLGADEGHAGQAKGQQACCSRQRPGAAPFRSGAASPAVDAGRQDAMCRVDVCIQTRTAAAACSPTCSRRPRSASRRPATGAAPGGTQCRWRPPCTSGRRRLPGAPPAAQRAAACWPQEQRCCPGRQRHHGAAPRPAPSPAGGSGGGGEVRSAGDVVVRKNDL